MLFEIWRLMIYAESLTWWMAISSRIEPDLRITDVFTEAQDILPTIGLPSYNWFVSKQQKRSASLITVRQELQATSKPTETLRCRFRVGPKVSAKSKVQVSRKLSFAHFQTLISQVVNYANATS